MSRFVATSRYAQVVAWFAWIIIQLLEEYEVYLVRPGSGLILFAIALVALPGVMFWLFKNFNNKQDRLIYLSHVLINLHLIIDFVLAVMFIRQYSL